MTTMTVVMELRGEMVAVTVEVYRHHGELLTEEEVVVDHPDWELTNDEIRQIKTCAIAHYKGDEDAIK